MEKNQSNLVQSFIERDETNIIKGIAIVFMFIHHFFTLPAFWTVSVSKMYFGIDYTMFCSSFKICVPLFAFLTGYFYFYSKNKTLIYSVKKATDLWITYLFVFFCFFIVGMIMGVYEFAFPRFITEMFALTSRTMTHGWYVTFYVGTILLLPVYHKVSEKSDFLAFSLFVIIPHLCSYLFEITPLYDRAPYIKDFIEEFFYLQVVAIGYICSKYNILQRLYSILLTQKKDTTMDNSYSLHFCSFFPSFIF